MIDQFQTNFRDFRGKMRFRPDDGNPARGSICRQTDFLSRFSRTDDLDKDLRCLLVHLLERSPSKRMSLHEAILHPALQRYMDPHIRFSSPALAAAILRGRIQDSSNSSSRDSGTLGPAFQGSETRVVEDNCYAMEAAALKFIRSPTPPPVLCLDASAEPFSLWLAEPTGNINDDKSSSSRSRRRISSNNKHDEDDNNGRSKL